MSDIGGIFSPFDLFVMALIAGSPGAAIGVITGALSWPNRRVTGALLGAVLGFFLCLTGVLIWLLAIK
jgi:hypothetical protein